MEESIKSAAAILGRMGGMARSEKKTAACRANAKLPRHRSWEQALYEPRHTPPVAERKARRKAQRLAKRITRAHQ